MNFKIIKNKNYIQFDFKDQTILAKSFLRFQEYYENDYFKGKIFSLSEFKRHYIKIYSSFDYYETWDGFNVPSYVFKPFLEGKFNPLTNLEKDIIDNLDFSKEFYLIGTVNGGDKDTLDHEVCHALFYSNKNYKKEVLSYLDLIKESKSYKVVKEHLIKKGYHEDVLLDEINAYMCELSLYLKEEYNIMIDKKIISDLKLIKEKYIGE